MGRTKRDFDTARGGRAENQSPVSVTTVEERTFKQGTEIWSSTSKRSRKKGKRELEQRGDKLGT